MYISAQNRKQGLSAGLVCLLALAMLVFTGCEPKTPKAPSPNTQARTARA